MIGPVEIVMLYGCAHLMPGIIGAYKAMVLSEKITKPVRDDDDICRAKREAKLRGEGIAG